MLLADIYLVLIWRKDKFDPQRDLSYVKLPYLIESKTARYNQ